MVTFIIVDSLIKTNMETTLKISVKTLNEYKIVWSDNTVEYLKGSTLENSIERKGYNPMKYTQINQYFVKPLKF